MSPAYCINKNVWQNGTQNSRLKTAKTTRHLGSKTKTLQLFSGNIKLSLSIIFQSYMDTGAVQVVKVLPDGGQGWFYPTQIILGLLMTWGPFYWHGLTSIPAQISNYIYHNRLDKITFLFPNFNGATVEVWEWISNFIPWFTAHVITYPCWD